MEQLPPPPIEEIRAAFPHLIIERFINSGGYKHVYQARRADGTNIALKLILSDTTEIELRTSYEKAASHKLNGSSFFAALHESDEIYIDEKRYLYLCEEYIEGTPLVNVLAVHGRLALPRIRQIGTGLLTALVDVEQAGIIHRDIKPGNIILRADDQPVLIDFGIARHVGKATITSDRPMGMMTIGYGAPEQIENKHLVMSSRTDLFALGVVLYEMAVGYNPFEQDAREHGNILVSIQEYDPPFLTESGYSKDFSQFVASCLEKQPHRRPPTARKAKALFDGISWS
jgi:eukaryotic-like serine/threonine-protein kinase